MLGLMGQKLGMTQVFGEGGDLIPVTAVKAGPCTVIMKKTQKTDGYNALQLGFGAKKAKRATKAMRMHFEKRGLSVFAHLKEFTTENPADFEVGQELCCAAFRAGDMVNVSGVTKGRGFQGVIKRHGKHGGPASHGSDFHRRPGSIGMRTWPGHVLKNMKLPGHMGDVNVTTKNLEVVAVRPDDDVILVRGAVPGTRNGMVVVVPHALDFEKRPELKRGGKSAPAAAPENAPEKIEQKKE